MNYVKVINRKSGMPQILTKSNWENINLRNPKLAKDLEFMHDCNEDGKAASPDVVTDQGEPNLKPNTNGTEAGQNQQKENKSDNGEGTGEPDKKQRKPRKS